MARPGTSAGKLRSSIARSDIVLWISITLVLKHKVWSNQWFLFFLMIFLCDFLPQNSKIWILTLVYVYYVYYELYRIRKLWHQGKDFLKNFLMYDNSMILKIVFMTWQFYLLAGIFLGLVVIVELQMKKNCCQSLVVEKTLVQLTALVC